MIYKLSFAELTVVDCHVCVSMFVLCSSNPMFIVVFHIKRYCHMTISLTSLMISMEVMVKWQNYVMHLNEQS